MASPIRGHTWEVCKPLLACQPRHRLVEHTNALLVQDPLLQQAHALQVALAVVCREVCFFLRIFPIVHARFRAPSTAVHAWLLLTVVRGMCTCCCAGI